MAKSYDKESKILKDIDRIESDIDKNSEISRANKGLADLKERKISNPSHRPKIDFIRTGARDENLELWHYPYKDKPHKKVLLKTFKYDKKVKRITNFSRQDRANEKVLLQYFKNKSDRKYQPNTKEKTQEQLKKIKRDRFTHTKHYLSTQSQSVFSPTKLNIMYDFMYISVKVKIYLDGYDTEAVGRSDHFYVYEWTNDKGRKYKAYENGIPQSMVSSAIEQATMRAVAPFGSEVEFDILSWQYAHHQREGHEI